MLRLFFFFSFIGLTFNALKAQTETASTERLSIQELPPAAANMRRASGDINRLTHHLAALKTAYAEKNTSQIIAYEANVFQDIRNEIAFKTEKAAETAPGNRNLVALEQMNTIFTALQDFSFDLADTQAASNAFSKFDAFLGIMQSEFDLLNAAKN